MDDTQQRFEAKTGHSTDTDRHGNPLYFDVNEEISSSYYFEGIKKAGANTAGSH